MIKQYVVSIFNDEDSLISAIRQAMKDGIRVSEVYTPFPIHEAFEATGTKTRFTLAAFLYGFAAAVGVLAFLQYTAVIDWPINYGGKPTNAFPSFIVVTIVLTILTITLASLFTFSVRAKVYPGKKLVLPDKRSTDDKFVIVFEKNGDDDFTKSLVNMLLEHGATEIHYKDSETLNQYQNDEETPTHN